MGIVTAASHRARFRVFLLSTSITLAPAALSIARETSANLASAEANAREIIKQAIQEKLSRSATKSSVPDGEVPTLGASGIATRRVTSWRGLSSERLAGILAPCPETTQRSVLKSIDFANGLWVGNPSPEPAGGRQCLGSDGYKRLLRLLSGTTYFDMACKMESGKCVTFGNQYCNDEDCDYFEHNSGTARTNHSCWSDGYCKPMETYWCNSLMCKRYANDGGTASGQADMSSAKR